jgi:hypothetical protein
MFNLLAFCLSVLASIADTHFVPRDFKHYDRQYVGNHSTTIKLAISGLPFVAVPPSMDACNDDRIAQIRVAVRDARILATAAIDALDIEGSETSIPYLLWFGAGMSTRFFRTLLL